MRGGEPVTLVEGVYRHRVAEAATPLVDDAEQGDVARSALEACRAIEADLTSALHEIRPMLDDAGVEIMDVSSVEGRQNHTITFDVPDAGSAEVAVGVLGAAGFEPRARWSGGALESFRRSAHHVTASRTDDTTTMVRFRWRHRGDASRLDRVVTPTEGDWHMVQLPSWAWWAYPAVRVARLALERLGLRPKHRSSLGPFLSTPDALLLPLFEHVGITADDVVVDLGAGDGRIVAAAAATYGCRAIGIEHDADLVDAANRRIAASGTTGLAHVQSGDARTADLSDVTVLIVFLPLDVVADLFDELIARLGAGSRVLVHEQSRPPVSLHPDSSTVIVGRNAMTVAHVWHVN